MRSSPGSPFDFGLRHASVVSAEAALTQARAGETLTRLDVQNAVGAAFFGVLAAQRAVIATEADLQRRNILLQSVQALVNNQLRPGADQSRMEAERAAAQTRVIQAQQSLAIAQATLNRVLGTTGRGVTIVADPLLTRLPGSDISQVAATEHPLARVWHASPDQVEAQEAVLGRTDFPRVFVQSSVFARGSGANTNGVFDGGPDGLGLDRANWAAGVQIQFPNLFDFSSLRARKAAAAASARASTALYDEALLTSPVSNAPRPPTCRLPAQSPRTPPFNWPRLSRVSGRLARDTTPGSRRSLRSRTRKACSPRRKFRINSHASMSGVPCSPMPPRKAI